MRPAEKVVSVILFIVGLWEWVAGSTSRLLPQTAICGMLLMIAVPVVCELVKIRRWFDRWEARHNGRPQAPDR